MILESEELIIKKEIQDIIENKKTNYIDAIIGICEKYQVDPEYIAKYIPKPLIQELQAEGEALNILPKTAKLPIQYLTNQISGVY